MLCVYCGSLTSKSRYDVCPRCISYDASGVKCTGVNIGFHSNVCASDCAFAVNSLLICLLLLSCQKFLISQREKNTKSESDLNDFFQLGSSKLWFS